MKILVAGLGLIGGSICKAIHAYTDHAVYGWNRTKAVSEKALSEHAIDGIAGEDCSEFDMILVSLYPELTKKWVRNHVASMHKGAIVLDVSGVKTTLPQEMTALCETYGVHYLSTHPMAGKERAGFDVSDENLFQGANFMLHQRVLRVGDEGEGQLVLRLEFLVRGRAVHAHAHHGIALRAQRAVAVAKAASLRRAAARVVLRVEIQHQLLAGKLFQAKLLAVLVAPQERGRLVSNLYHVKSTV